MRNIILGQIDYFLEMKTYHCNKELMIEKEGGRERGEEGAREVGRREEKKKGKVRKIIMNVWGLANILFIFNIVIYSKKGDRALTAIKSEKGSLPSAWDRDTNDCDSYLFIHINFLSTYYRSNIAIGPRNT